VLQTQPYAANVDGDDAIENLERIIGDRLDVALDAGVGEVDIDAAVALDGSS